MNGCEEGQQRNCGRYIFREADLAFLLIDGEKMFPLAELLASLFSNTARTTLFTRMEKINTRRHFCSAEEIKLLKTVNGIHGSSAICTLIPEADVQKYCEVYIDRTVDIKLFSTSIRRSKSVRNFISKTKDSKQDKGGTENSNSTAKNNEGKQATSSNVESDKDLKSLRGKNASSGKQKFDNRGKAKVPWVAKTTHKSNHSELLGECYKSEVNEDPNSLATLAEHVLNGTQTLQNRRGVKAGKKRKAKDCLEDSFTKSNHRKNKKAKRTDESKESEGILCPPWQHRTTLRPDVNGNISSVGPTSSPTAKLEHSCASSLSQCLTNANSEILFSDVSSNDSGFASTTISESLIRKKPSACLDSNRRKKAHNLTVSLPSPSKPVKCKKLKKIRVEPEEDKQQNQSLSPPALVLKRQNNTWQVETKSELEDKRFNRSTFPTTAKKRLKWTSCQDAQEHDKKLKNQKGTRKKKIKKKKRQKGTISDKDEASAFQVVSQGRNVMQNRKIKRKRLNQQGNCNVDEDAGNTVKTVKRGKKSKQVTNNLQNTKKIAAAKTLKANKDFKFMSLFSSFPLLSVKDGELCPSFSETLAVNVKKPLSTHPIWKWQQGGPIFVPEGRKAYVK